MLCVILCGKLLTDYQLYFIFFLATQLSDIFLSPLCLYVPQDWLLTSGMWVEVMYGSFNPDPYSLHTYCAPFFFWWLNKQDAEDLRGHKMKRTTAAWRITYWSRAPTLNCGRIIIMSYAGPIYRQVLTICKWINCSTYKQRIEVTFISCSHFRIILPKGIFQIHARLLPTFKNTTDGKIVYFVMFNSKQR